MGSDEVVDVCDGGAAEVGRECQLECGLKKGSGDEVRTATTLQAAAAAATAADVAAMEDARTATLHSRWHK